MYIIFKFLYSFIVFMFTLFKEIKIKVKKKVFQRVNHPIIMRKNDFLNVVLKVSNISFSCFSNIN